MSRGFPVCTGVRWTFKAVNCRTYVRVPNFWILRYAMWVRVPQALGHDLVCLLWDTMLNGAKALFSHYLLYSTMCYVDMLICFCHGCLSGRGLPICRFCHGCPREWGGAAPVPMLLLHSLLDVSIPKCSSNCLQKVPQLTGTSQVCVFQLFSPTSFEGEGDVRGQS
jgi:hypothetical protein